MVRSAFHLEKFMINVRHGASMAGYLLTFSVALALAASPAAAGIKEGVDAWQRGDYAAAVEQWRQPAIAGDADAQFNLGQAYRLGRGAEVDLGLAEGWYGKAARQGHAQAAANYGLVLFQNGNRTAAMPWLAKAAERGDPRAQYVYGTALFNGDGVKKDWVRAYAMMSRAAAAGLSQATPSLAEMDKYLSPVQREQGQALSRELAGTQQSTNNWAPSQPIRPGNTHELPVEPATPAATPVAPTTEKTTTPRLNPAVSPVVVNAVRVPASSSSAAAVQTTPSWRVQLGVFSDVESAQAEWKRIKPKIGGLSSLQPLIIPVGKMVRLRAGTINSRQDADHICRNAQAVKVPCLALRD